METPAVDEAITEFLETRRAEGRAAITLEGYRENLRAFFREHPDAWPDESALKAAVRRHFADLQEKGAAPSFVALRRSVLGSFFHWAVSEEYIDFCPTDGLRLKRAESRPRAVDRDVLRRLLDLPDQGRFVGIRDRALLLLQIDCGLRPSEALSLLPADFDLPRHAVTIRAAVSKTGRERTLPLSAATVRAVRRLLACRPDDWDVEPVAPVFCTASGRRMSRWTWAQRLRAYSKCLGEKVTPYCLRHSFATEFLRQGGNLFALQATLGHQSLAMTRRYAEITADDLRREHASASPLVALLGPGKTRVRKAKPTKGGNSK